MAISHKATAITDVSSLFPSGTYDWLEVWAMLVTDDTVSTECVSLRGSAWSAKCRFLTVKLVLAIIVVSSVKSALPPRNGVCFDFLGYSSWVLAECIGDAGVAHLAIQGSFDELSILGCQVFILFHSRYLLNPRYSRKRIAQKAPEIFLWGLTSGPCRCG